jgi:hypothetical protein
VKVHYEGTAVSTKLLTDHDACIAEWKAIRASHLANTVENYSDIAYNYGACPHGFLLEGRGIGKRTGANGNQELNIAHYAIVGLVGSSGLVEPTDGMLGAIRDGIELLRAHGAGMEIKGHRDGYATACPGTALYAWVQQGAPRPTEEEIVDLTAQNLTDIATKVLTLDGVIDNPNPDTAPGNPYISLETAVRNIEIVARRTEKALAALPAVELTDVQIATLAAAVAANPALAELIAEKVAVKLAERLAE